jgi:hypothetical protein
LGGVSSAVTGAPTNARAPARQQIFTRLFMAVRYSRNAN